MAEALIRATTKLAGHSDLWWRAPSPWPGIPAADQPFRCCAGEVSAPPQTTVESVELHLPSRAGDPMFTITLAPIDDERQLEHLQTEHGFSVG